MRFLLQIVSYLALCGIIFPPVLYLSDILSKSSMSTAMIIASVLWFVTVPFWMGRKA